MAVAICENYDLPSWALWLLSNLDQVGGPDTEGTMDQGWRQVESHWGWVMVWRFPMGLRGGIKVQCSKAAGGKIPFEGGDV